MFRRGARWQFDQLQAVISALMVERDDLARIVTETKKRSSDRAIEIEKLREELAQANAEIMDLEIGEEK
jgi:hypothetical protein